MSCAATAAKRPAWAARALRSLLTLTLAGLGLAAAGSAWADPPGRVGRIADTDGAVWLFEDDDGEWVQARRNRPVTEGDRVSVERGGRAEVQIGSATLRLDGATEVEFDQLDDARVRVRVHGGTAALRVRGGEVSVREFALVTREGRYEPTRPGLYRVDVRDSSSLGEVLSGALRFEAHDSVFDLADNQRAEFWSEGGVTHYAWASPERDRFGDWVARADREETRQRNRYVSPEMTGADDLDRYGQWDRHPEYGTVWYPTTVVAGWAPYRYGHWAYIRPWGWTWVDDAPWGFAPFHYGRWVYWGGRWGWAPGQYVARPVYAPALVAWFGGPRVSVGISVGGPAVGWVPLAPREVYYPTYSVTNVYVRNVNVTHRHWHGPTPRYERTVPTGPIMYTNQGVAGGVTVVPQAVMQSRQPISSRVVVPVDSRTVSSWQAPAAERGARDAVVRVPPPPVSRVVAQPGGAVPAAPGAVRPAPWASGPRVGAAQGDGGRALRTAPPSRDDDTARGAERRPQDRRDDSRDARDARGERGAVERRAPLPPVSPVMPAAQPPVVARPGAAPSPGHAAPGPGAVLPSPGHGVPRVEPPQRPMAPAARPRDNDEGDDRGRGRGDARGAAGAGPREVPVVRPAPQLREPPERREAERRPNDEQRRIVRDPREQQNR